MVLHTRGTLIYTSTNIPGTTTLVRIFPSEEVDTDSDVQLMNSFKDTMWIDNRRLLC